MQHKEPDCWYQDICLYLYYPLVSAQQPLDGLEDAVCPYLQEEEMGDVQEHPGRELDDDMHMPDTEREDKLFYTMDIHYLHPLYLPLHYMLFYPSGGVGPH